MNTFKARNGLYPNKKIVFFIIRLCLVIPLIYFIWYLEKQAANKTFLYQLSRGLSVPLVISLLVSTGAFLLINLYSRGSRNYENSSNVILGINRIGSIINGVFILIGIMMILGINPKDFLTSITLVAMAIALIFREYITNMISGLFIMFSNRFRLGDIIQSGTFKGTITDITLANIILKSEDEQFIFIPNNNAFTSTFQNLSNADSPFHVINFSLPHGIPLDTAAVQEAIKKALHVYKDFVLADETQLALTQIRHEEKKYKVRLHLRHKGDAFKRKMDTLVLDLINNDLLCATHKCPEKRS